MVNIFKRQTHENREDEHQEGEDREQYPAPDERTRLLPRETERYLSPDDPAVCSRAPGFLFMYCD